MKNAARCVLVLVLASIASQARSSDGNPIRPPRYLRHEIFRLRAGASAADSLEALALWKWPRGLVPVEQCAVVGSVAGIARLRPEDLNLESWHPEISQICTGSESLIVTLAIERAVTRSPWFSLAAGDTLRVAVQEFLTEAGGKEVAGRDRPFVRAGDRIACMLHRGDMYGRDTVIRPGSHLLLPDEADLIARPALADSMARIWAVYTRAALEPLVEEDPAR